MMKKLDDFESELLADFEQGKLKSISPSKEELTKFKAAATATFLKEKRINIRLSSPDLMDIQARALEEGLPYQTLIASILHKFVSGRFIEKPSQLAHDTNQ
jgi:predicted DNA binding CopG/RHH family protein